MRSIYEESLYLRELINLNKSGVCARSNFVFQPAAVSLIRVTMEQSVHRQSSARFNASVQLVLLVQPVKLVSQRFIMYDIFFSLFENTLFVLSFNWSAAVCI